jgi:hypothetical protein
LKIVVYFQNDSKTISQSLESEKFGWNEDNL